MSNNVVITYDGTLVAARLIDAAAGEAVKQAADAILELSTPDVPVAEYQGGFLRDSGEVDADLSDARATVSYESPPPSADGRRVGSGNLAVWVHENTGVRHAVGCAKFLEKAFKTFAPRFEGFIGSHIRARVP